ncbi:MAG: PRTRC system protein E [Candidatus Competibacter denitrificans]|jgi:PRTRC genetic system protein E
MTLFSLLADCLAAEEKLHFELRREGVGLTVLILPQLKPSAETSDPTLQAVRTALTHPLVLRGTPQGLDQELPTLLAQYARQRTALRTEVDGLAALDTALENARQAADEKRRKGAPSQSVTDHTKKTVALSTPPADPTVNPDSLF